MIRCPQCNGQLRHGLILEEDAPLRVYCTSCEGEYSLEQFVRTALQDYEETGGIDNRAFAGSWKMGWVKGFIGEPKESPYADHRTDGGSVTYSRAFAKYWEEGWDVGKRDGKGVKSARSAAQGTAGGS